MCTLTSLPQQNPQVAVGLTEPGMWMQPVVTYYVLPILLVLFVAATRRNVFIRLATLVTCVSLSVCGTRYTTGGGAAVDYTFGCQLGINCITAWWLLFYLKLDDLRHEEDPMKPWTERTSSSRVYWLSILWFGQRGVGWNVEVRAAHAFAVQLTDPWSESLERKYTTKTGTLTKVLPQAQGITAGTSPSA